MIQRFGAASSSDLYYGDIKERDNVSGRTAVLCSHFQSSAQTYCSKHLLVGAEEACEQFTAQFVLSNGIFNHRKCQSQKAAEAEAPQRPAHAQNERLPI